MSGRELFLQYDNNSVYYILKAVKLLLRIHKNNSLLEFIGTLKLLSYSENNLEQVGKILSTRDLRKTAWHFLDYGASTALILQNRLGVSGATMYRYMSDLRVFKFIVPAVKTRGEKGKKGRRTLIWMVPDGTPDQINEARKLHYRLLSPKYRVAEEVAQSILEDYIAPRDISEITYREILIYVKEQKMPFMVPDIALLAAQYLQEKGIKVWR